MGEHRTSKLTEAIKSNPDQGSTTVGIPQDAGRDWVDNNDTELWNSYKCKLDAMSIVNILSEIRRGMITNNLKMNSSKTELIVLIYPQLKCDLSCMSVNVGESQIIQSSKVRDLGVMFD